VQRLGYGFRVLKLTTRLNYLLWNPVKHGYVTRLADWPCSSFHRCLDAMGTEQLKAQFRGYSDFRELPVEDDF